MKITKHLFTTPKGEEIFEASIQGKTFKVSSWGNLMATEGKVRKARVHRKTPSFNNVCGSNNISVKDISKAILDYKFRIN